MARNKSKLIGKNYNMMSWINKQISIIWIIFYLWINRKRLNSNNSKLYDGTLSSYVYTLRLIGPISYPDECSKLVKPFSKICSPSSRLHHLLPPTRSSFHNRTLRNCNELSLYKYRTERFKGSFFPMMCKGVIYIVHSSLASLNNVHFNF